MTILNYLNKMNTTTLGLNANSELLFALKKPIDKTLKKNKLQTNVNLKWIKEILNRNPRRNNLKLQSERKIPIRSYYGLDWKWNSDKEDIILSDDSKSVCLHPDCQGCFETIATRGSSSLKSNAFTYWEVTLENNVTSCTSIMIGIGTKSARLNSAGYIHLLGSDQSSWGVTHTGLKCHNNQISAYCEPLLNINNSSQTGSTTIGCLFDGYNGRLVYFKNGQSLGVAFENFDMKSNEYFPMVSSTLANSIFKFEFACQSFPSLKALCKQEINSHSILSKNIQRSNLPNEMVQYLN